MQKEHLLPRGALLRLHFGAAGRAALAQAAALGCGFAASGTRLFGVMTPLGLALALGAEPPYFAAAAAGAAMGLLARPGADTVALLCALAAATAVRWSRPQPYRAAALAGGGVLCGGAALLAASGAAAPSDLAAAVCTAGCAAALGWEMRRRPLSAGGAGLLAPGMIAAAVLGGYAAGPVLPGTVFCAGVGLVYACRGRREQALCAAVGVCAALCAAESGLAFAAAGICAGTLLAVSFGAGRRGLCAGLFLLGTLPGVFCAPSAGAAWRFLLAAALAVLAFWLMPQRWVLAVPAADPAESGGRPAVSAAATRLSAVAESLAGIAETVNGVYEALPKRGETYNWVVQRVQDELCAACARREDCWQAGYSDSVSGMFALKPRLEQTGRVEIEDLPAAFSRCIHPTALCGAAGRAWAQYCARRTARVQADALRAALTEQYDAVAAALAALAGQLGAPGLPEPYQTGRVAALFASLGMEPLECAVTLDALGRTQCAVTLPRRSLSEAELAALAGEVGRLCRRPMDPPQKLSCREATTLLFSEKPALRPVFGAAGLPASGAVSGDAVQQFCVPGAADMLLCDGMGTGCPAAVDGNLAAELTARLLRAGFAPDTAARLVNVALSLKSEDESGATLDLVQVDLFTGAARLFKAGAAPGFAVLGGKAAVLGGQGLPVGILPKVEARTQSFRLCPGDWVVLVSDGMLVDGPDWILQQLELSAAAGAAPDALAQLLVKTARMRAERAGRPDDITAAVLRLEKAV